MKAKKYETLIFQLWELLPIFCRYNSPQLSGAVASLLPFLEPMVNRNDYGLRSVALRSFSELINHCRNTPVVTEEIKKTRAEELVALADIPVRGRPDAARLRLRIFKRRDA